MLLLTLAAVLLGPPVPPEVVLDGQYGEATTAAVRRYQQAHHLPVDGLAGPRTLGALGLVGDGLAPGDQGPAVLVLQRALALSGALAVPPPVPAVAARPKPPGPRPTPTPRPTAPAPSPFVRPSAPAPSPQPVASLPPESGKAPAETPRAWGVVPEAWSAGLRVGAWFNTLSGTDTGFSYAHPSYDAEALLRHGRWGVSLAGTWLDPGADDSVPLRFYQPNTWLLDGLLRYGSRHTELLAGYRVMTQHGADFLLLGAAFEHPAGPLVLRGRGLVGASTSLGYTFDMRGALAWGPLEAGYRSLVISRALAGEPGYQTAGPYLTLAF